MRNGSDVHVSFESPLGQRGNCVITDLVEIPENFASICIIAAQAGSMFKRTQFTEVVQKLLL